MTAEIKLRQVHGCVEKVEKKALRSRKNGRRRYLNHLSLRSVNDKLQKVTIPAHLPIQSGQTVTVIYERCSGGPDLPLRLLIHDSDSTYNLVSGLPPFSGCLVWLVVMPLTMFITGTLYEFVGLSDTAAFFLGLFTGIIAAVIANRNTVGKIRKYHQRYDDAINQYVQGLDVTKSEDIDPDDDVV